MTHQIQKQILDVTFHAPESAASVLQHRLSEWANGSLAAAVAQALDACTTAEEHLYLEELTIEIKTVSLDNFEHELPHQIAQALTRAIKDKLAQTQGAKAILKTSNQSTMEALGYFLQTGLLPWAYRIPTGQTWEQTIREAFLHEPALMKSVLLPLLQNVTVRERLITQFSQSFLEEILAYFHTQSIAQVKLFFETLFAVNNGGISVDIHLIIRQIWNDLWEKVAESQALEINEVIQKNWQNQDRSTRNILEKAIVPLAKQDAVYWGTLLTQLQSQKYKSNLSRTSDKDTTPLEVDEIYLPHAGLVLLHPFLPRFFEGILCAADDELVWVEKAALSLHFLATGQSEAPEYELAVAKVLCGIPLGQTLPKAVAWQQQDTEEAEALLGAIIKYWPVLKDSSIDILRAEFLQRAGKLSRRADGWLLQVEKRDFDIYLLAELPWSFSTIKLPWMKEFLWVEWI